MEKHIGMTGFDIDALDAAADEFEPLTKDLHIANTSLIWLDCTTNFELALEKFSEEMVALLIKSLQSTVSAGQSSQRVRGQGNQKDCNGRTAGQQGYEDNCGTYFVFSSRDPDSKNLQ
ncbi:hypothetical protein MMC15_006877 [Xylographa vitiligo]|nr:hypothetical protein [Xylographa vitiligo]